MGLFRKFFQREKMREQKVKEFLASFENDFSEEESSTNREITLGWTNSKKIYYVIDSKRCECQATFQQFTEVSHWIELSHPETSLVLACEWEF